MKPVLIIQNDAHEGAGQLATILAQRGVNQEKAFGESTNYELLRPDLYSGLIVLGGAQGVYEADTYSYLQKEMDLCLSFVDANKPIAGFCLGAQLLASALGGEVVPNERKEIGWYDITLSDSAKGDPLMTGQPHSLLAYHFHGDVINDVPGAVNLARSTMTEWQLFRFGLNAYGFQYHAEVDQNLIEVMCRNNSEYMAAQGIDSDTVIKQSLTNLPRFESCCAQVLNRWVDLCSV
jgi:GMP synthase (glutamine-hydrolysing)